MRLLHRVSILEQAIAADGVVQFDLPTNPLSVVMLGVRPLNNTGTLSSYVEMMGLAGGILRASIIRDGVTVFSMSGRDLLAYNYFRHGIVPLQYGGTDTNNFQRCLPIPMIVGRWAYDASSCLSESVRGACVLEIDFDIAATGFDGMRFSAETIELIGAKPKYAERKTTLSQTFAATGDNDVNLPGGDLLRGILLFGTTSFTGTTPAPSWGRISIFKDGEQEVYSSTDFEMLGAVSGLMGRQPPAADAHFHRVDATAAVTTEPTGSRVDAGVSGGYQNYAYLDLDPTRDDAFSIDATKVNSLFIRANAETGDAVRVMPIQRLLNT